MKLEKTFTIRNKLGLHARSAAKIVELAGRFESCLYLSKDGCEVEGNSILSILTLACIKGAEVTARIEGQDAREFMDSLGELIEQKFGEPQ